VNGLLLGSLRLYEKLLLLYPDELRHEFGDEMALAFADDLEAAWGDARIAGLIQIWWYALCELLTVALPAQKSNPSVLAPALAFLMAAATLGAELWLALHHVTRVDRSLLLDDIRWAVLLPSTANAAVAFVVTRVYRRCSIASLQLAALKVK
jgi:hypothetical protein